MQPSIPPLVYGVALVSLMISLSACDDHAVNPNEPSLELRRHDGLTQLESSLSVGISQLSLTSKTVTIGGSVGYTASVVSASTSFKGLSVRGSIVQQQVRYPVVNQGLPCGFGSTTCTFNGTISATAAALVPGAALFELQLVDRNGNVLSASSIPLMLIEGPLESPPVGPGAEFNRSVRSSASRLARP